MSEYVQPEEQNRFLYAQLHQIQYDGAGISSFAAQVASAPQPGSITHSYPLSHILPSSPAYSSQPQTGPVFPTPSNGPIPSNPPPQPGSQGVRSSWLSRFSKTRKDEACWRCRNSHTKCIHGSGPDSRLRLCNRCAKPSGNLSIPCLYGNVCDLVAEVPWPLLCHTQEGAKKSPRVKHMPPDLYPASVVLSNARQRRMHDKANTSEMHDSDRTLFGSIIRTKVSNINRIHPLEEMKFIEPLGLRYDELLANIVWELEDQPQAAAVMGIDSVENLVALLEVASVSESEDGHHEEKRRLVYSSMQLIYHCLQALRLSDHKVLAANPHAHCTQANECISPAFRGLTRYVVAYSEALTMAFFSKSRNDRNHWLLVFYSLCLQSHVRFGLMALELRLRPVGIEAREHQPPLDAAQFLATAINLFEQISLQNDGKLAKKISSAQVKPSKYLRRATGRIISWRTWRNVDDIKQHVRSIFDVAIPIGGSISAAATVHHPQQHISSPALGPGTEADADADSDSDKTMRSLTPTGPTTTDAVGQASGFVHSRADCGDGHSVVDSDSVFSATTGGESSETWTLNTESTDTMSVDESVISNGTVVPHLPFSMHLAAQMATDNGFVDHYPNHDMMFNDDFPIEWGFGFGSPG